MTEYRAIGAPGEVAFAAKLPGHIVPVDVGPGREYMVHRHGFLCATPAIELSVGFQQSLGAGIFGGDGFLLQKIAGQGIAWLELSGELVIKDLAPGEVLRVHPGHVGSVSDEHLVQHYDGAGDQECDLWRGRDLSGAADGAGKGMAADAAHLATGACAGAIHAETAWE